MQQPRQRAAYTHFDRDDYEPERGGTLGTAGSLPEELKAQGIEARVATHQRMLHSPLQEATQTYAGGATRAEDE